MDSDRSKRVDLGRVLVLVIERDYFLDGDLVKNEE